MPEIWLPYGEAEVVINVKAENLNEVVESNEKPFTEEELAERLQNIELPDVVIHDEGRWSKKIVALLQKLWGAGQANYLEVKQDITRIAAQSEQTELTLIDGSMVKVPRVITNRKVLSVSATYFDPIFGFSGAHTLLIHAAGLFGEAVKRWNKKPEPGGDPDSGWFATRFAGSLPDAKALSFVTNLRGIVNISYGKVEESVQSAREYLKQKRIKQVNQSRLTILGCGGIEHDRTLATSLLSVGNNIQALQEDSEVIIVAECSEGIGSQYLRNMIDGALFSRQGSWEEILLASLSEKGNLHLVSTLPNTIVERRLKMKPYSSIREAFEAAQQAHAWRLKANIITDSSAFYISPSSEKGEEKNDKNLIQS